MTLQLPRGKYHYRLLADGEWPDDPSTQQTAVHPFGGFAPVMSFRKTKYLVIKEARHKNRARTRARSTWLRIAVARSLSRRVLCENLSTMARNARLLVGSVESGEEDRVAFRFGRAALTPGH